MAEILKVIKLSTGIEVLIPKISISTLMLDLVRAFPKPQPPNQVVKLAGKESVEVNYAHPGYEKALREWEQDLQMVKAAELVLRMVADLNHLDEGAKLAVSEKRDLLGDMLGNQNDKMIWLRYVAIQNDDDLKAVMQAVRSGEPSEKGIESISDGFRGNA